VEYLGELILVRFSCTLSLVLMISLMQPSSQGLARKTSGRGLPVDVSLI